MQRNRSEPVTALVGMFVASLRHVNFTERSPERLRIHVKGGQAAQSLSVLYLVLYYSFVVTRL